MIIELKELTFSIADDILNDFKKLPFHSYECENLLETAWQIAVEYQSIVYDSMYLALAQTEGCLLVTADRVFYNIFHETPLAPLLLWVENI